MNSLCDSLKCQQDSNDTVIYCSVQIHLLIESPFYTDRIVRKMANFNTEEKCFVRIRSHKSVLFQDTSGNKEMSLVQLNRHLNTLSPTRCYIHFLSSSIAYILHKTKLAEKPCYWIMWGADFYGLPAFSQQYYLPKSKPFAWKNDGFKSKLIQFLGLPSSKYVMNIFKDIDFFVGYEEEFTLTQMALQHNMKFLPWEYYFNIQELDIPPINQGQGPILLGNSDDPMNNHLDTLEQLEKVISPNQKIIIPVAGADEAYFRKLKEYKGNSKAEILLIENFMNSDAFFNLMSKVSYVVYGHLRQQGVGTIIPLLFAGKKAFLWDVNPLKGILTRWGLSVSSLDKISPDDFTLLQPNEVERQRKALRKVLSVKADKKRWEKILN